MSVSVAVSLLFLVFTFACAAFALWIAWRAHRADDGVRDDDVLDRGMARVRRRWQSSRQPDRDERATHP